MGIKGSISIEFGKISKVVNSSLPLATLFFGFLGYYINFSFHFLTVTFFLLTFVNFFYRHVQKRHTLLTNFGIIAQARYMIESVGPEFRQYLFSSDTEEKPFSRTERSEVYRKSKAIDSSSAYGSQLLFNNEEIKLRHSMYPLEKSSLKPYKLTFGEERGIKNTYTMTKPIIISAMSYGALGHKAVRALARGARKAQIAMNTGEGGCPKYHFKENCDLIFQMGTAKFGVRTPDGTLDEDRLKHLAHQEQVKMIEIKLSQGAKPGKGGLLPKEKITEEISKLRGVPMGKDIISPSSHKECKTPELTIQFIKKVQDISHLPVGIKLCLGRESEFRKLAQEMKIQNIYPDYIAIDGAEGGTGAAPKSFMDDFGVPIFKALPTVQKILTAEGVRSNLKLIASGKLISPSKQAAAMAMGADAIYTARGFLLALGCLQTLDCNKNTCPVGLTTHDPHLQNGLDIEHKSERVCQYVERLMHDHEEILSSLGRDSMLNLDQDLLFQEGVYE